MGKQMPSAYAIAVTVLANTLMMMMNVTSSSARTVAYIANAESREIYVLELHENDGTVDVTQKMPTAGAVMPLAVSPDRKYLYAALASKPYSVSSFAIDPGNGMLTPVTTVPLADDMPYLATDRTGRYLFGASYGGNLFSVNRLGPDGGIDAKPLAVVPTGKKAHCIVTDRSNRFLFVTNLGDDKILQYRFDESNGAATPNDPPAAQTTAGAGPRHLVFHPNGRFVFNTNELDGSVNSYALDSLGRLTFIESYTLIPKDFQGRKPSSADLHLTPDGQFLYASERTSNTLAAFRVDTDTGRLTFIDNYPTETQPRGFNIDPEGKYLLAVGTKSNRLTIYGIEQKDGTLRKLSQLEIGRNPNWVEIITLPH